MAFGIGRKKADETPVDESTDQHGSHVDRRKNKPRKPNEKLSSVVRETTPAVALQLVRENTRFLVEDGAKGAILLLNVDKQLGGLSQKFKNDPDKGSIIELINGDRITILATRDMLEAETFGIIPTADTLRKMYEYEILLKATYMWGLVDLHSETLDITGPAVPPEKATVDYATVRQISDGNLVLDTVLAASKAEPATDVLPPVTEHEVVTSASAQDEIDADAEIPEDDDPTFGPDGEGDFDPEAELESDEDYGDVYDDGDLDEPYADVETASDDVGEPPYEQDGEPFVDDDVDVDEHAVNAALTRRLLDEELGLSVDVSDFDLFYGSRLPVVLFDTTESEGWLSDQVNELRVQANADISRAHRESVVQLSQRFLDLTARYGESVQERVSVDPENPDAYFRKLLVAAEEDRQRNTDNANREISARQDKLRAAFEAEGDVKAKAAASDAKLRHTQMYGARLEAEIAAVSASVLGDIDASYQKSRHEVLDLRTVDARRSLERGISKILSNMSADAQAESDKISAVYAEWDKRILEYIDEHRKEDVARIAVIDDQLRQGEEADRVRAEFTRELEQTRETFARRTTEIEERHAAQVKVYEDRLSASDERFQEVIEGERKRSADLRNQVDHYIEQLNTIEPRAKADAERIYTEHLAQAKARADQAEATSQSMENMQRRNNILLTTIIIAVAVLAVVVGILIGVKIGSGGGDASGTILLTNHLSGLLGSAGVLGS